MLGQDKQGKVWLKYVSTSYAWLRQVGSGYATLGQIRSS
jgi:hypothetical protein